MAIYEDLDLQVSKVEDQVAKTLGDPSYKLPEDLYEAVVDMLDEGTGVDLTVQWVLDGEFATDEGYDGQPDEAQEWEDFGEVYDDSYPLYDGGEY